MLATENSISSQSFYKSGIWQEVPPEQQKEEKKKPSQRKQSGTEREKSLTRQIQRQLLDQDVREPVKAGNSDEGKRPDRLSHLLAARCTGAQVRCIFLTNFKKVRSRTGADCVGSLLAESKPALSAHLVPVGLQARQNRLQTTDFPQRHV